MELQPATTTIVSEGSGAEVDEGAVGTGSEREIDLDLLEVGDIVKV